MKFYDAENQILGRLASVVAKDLLNGEKIVVVNSEKAVLSSNPRWAKDHYLHKYERGDPIHGPFFPKQPDLILRRTVRGMLPWDKPRGRNAFRNLKAFVGVPAEASGKQLEKASEADANKLRTKVVTLGEVAQFMGGKKKW